MKTKVILFDLGGVLVKLGDFPFNPQWLKKKSDSDFEWLSCQTGRLFEKGLITSDQFADSLIADLSLAITKDQLLDYFTYWPSGLYPGVENLLTRLQSRYSLAVLSNTNALHWPRLMGEMKLEQYFDFTFASHLIQLAKPEPEIFEYVMKQLKIPAEDILFLDDNAMNVNAAQVFGIQSQLVTGDQDLFELIENLQD